MENYIVRIYRRDENNPENVTGMLESVEQETRQSFHSLGALQALLTPHPGSQASETPPTDLTQARPGTSAALLK